MDEPSSPLAGLALALEIAGGTAALTRSLGVTKAAVSNWRAAGGIPVSRVPAVAQITGLSPAELRPDLFNIAEPQTRPVQGLAESQASYLVEARSLGLDGAAIAARAVREAVGAERARRWAEENREAIVAHSRYIEEHGLPLAEYRMF